MTVLVTGATGYIGGRLTSRLVERGLRVRLLVRDPRRLRGRWWENDVEMVQGDLFDYASLERALDGVTEAYYLVHSMAAGDDFDERDRIAARNFVRAGGRLRHCLYLGGLVPAADGVSKHLRSRAETGAILREGLPTTEFRAGPIVGSGSASFEMVRYLTERLPFMLAPRWITNQVQPIAVRDVLTYLLAAREREPMGAVDIGGADRLSFRDMLRQYGEVRGLRRVIVAAPVLAPSLAALWVDKVTPIPRSVVEPLVEGIVHPVLADTTRARALFPEIEPMGYRTAVERALARMSEHAVESRWSDALGAGESYELLDREGVLEETRAQYVDATPDQVFRAFCKLGGDQGWLVWNFLWRARGFVDRLVGGPGLRRGRRDPEQLLPGEVVDFWRVELIEPPRLLRLRAEMRVPGKAWLQFTAVPEGQGTRLLQTALFAPRGLLGLLYWYAMYPAHLFIFGDMVRAIARLAQQEPATALVRPSRPRTRDEVSAAASLPEFRS
ncbi:MAG TPA: SDR family oxidoreductase [Gemmatimonadaceae bacterium]|nr:SDR family oxidoreductase [Gemmatimonadaceae bacterium]